MMMIMRRTMILAALAVAAIAGRASGQAATPTPAPTPTFSLYRYRWNEPFRHHDEDRLKIEARVRAADQIGAEVQAARGTAHDLGTRLDVALNTDGTIRKGAAADIVSEWLPEGGTVAYASGASFTVTGDGDLTGVYVAGRGLRLHLSSGYVYTYVYASTYSSPDTTVTLPTSCIDSTLDGADYSILSNGKTMPTGADIIAGNATVTGTLTASGTTKIASGAVAGHVLSCIDSSGTVIWSAPGAVVLVDDAVSSQKISEADGTSGQNTNGGTGVKRGHIQNYAIDQYKLDPGLLTGTSVGYGLVPIGAIVMWSGSAANIPLGWHLCDGNDGTPDLRDRFVLGAGATYAVGATGGSVSAAHTHAGPSHTHSVAAHKHGKGTLATRPSSAELGNVQGGTGAQANWTTHTHTITGETATGGDGTTGASGTEDTGPAKYARNSLPPYYALCFIMKL